MNTNDTTDRRTPSTTEPKGKRRGPMPPELALMYGTTFVMGALCAVTWIVY